MAKSVLEDQKVISIDRIVRVGVTRQGRARRERFAVSAPQNPKVSKVNAPVAVEVSGKNNATHPKLVGHRFKISIVDYQITVGVAQ